MEVRPASVGGVGNVETARSQADLKAFRGTQARLGYALRLKKCRHSPKYCQHLIRLSIIATTVTAQRVGALARKRVPARRFTKSVSAVSPNRSGNTPAQGS
jgi:hypothetical protein